MIPILFEVARERIFLRGDIAKISILCIVWKNSEYMTQLPESDELDIASLSAVFQNTTNSYKFYWFLAILDSLQQDGEQLVISQKDLALRMLASVWYPLDYFKLSFGAQDGFKQVASLISSKVEIDNRPNAPNLLKQINLHFSADEVAILGKEINKNLIRWVPFRFIRPFFAVETRGISDEKVNKEIERLSYDLFQSQPGRVIYRISEGTIELNPIWAQYLQKHQNILRGFIYWHLVRFVQKNNPNVIGLTEKLEKPADRKLGLAKAFWKSFLKENSNVTCIYSGKLIDNHVISLDHFLPWSYVAHDQLWNIVPTFRSINSSKSNCLPSLDLYFDKFLALQYQIVQFYLKKKSGNLLEDYDQIFKVDLKSLSEEEFSKKLREHLFPHFQSARNLGFEYPYIYSNSKPDE